MNISALPETYQIAGKQVRVSDPYSHDGGKLINITLANTSDAREDFKIIKAILNALRAAGITCHTPPRDTALTSLEVDIDNTARLGNARNRDFNADSVVELVHNTLETLQQSKGNIMSKKDYTIAGQSVQVGDIFENNGKQVMDIKITSGGGANENRTILMRLTNALALKNFNTSVITENQNQVGVQIDLTASLPHIQRTEPTATIEQLPEKIHATVEQVAKTSEIARTSPFQVTF
jgi:hypothetical protein